jgi:hypothetical protein
MHGCKKGFDVNITSGHINHDVVDYWDSQVKILVSITFGLPACWLSVEE